MRATSRAPITSAQSAVLHELRELGPDSSTSAIASRSGVSLENTIRHLEGLNRKGYATYKRSSDGLARLWTATPRAAAAS